MVISKIIIELYKALYVLIRLYPTTKNISITSALVTPFYR